MKRVEYFKFVRDIPYRMPSKLERNNYACHGKHTVLKKLLETTKAEVRYRICEFYWDDFRIIPENIMRIPHKKDGIHVYLEMKHKDKWIILDATLDKALEPELPANDWDGKHNTRICVKTRNIYTPEQSIELYKNYDYLKDLQTNQEFYKALNQFFESIREKNRKTS